MWRLREARSPFAPILFPVKKWMVEAGSAGYLADAESAVRIVFGSTGPLDVRTQDLQAARDVVPQDVRHADEEMAISALRRSSSLDDHADAAGTVPDDRHDQHADRRGLAIAAPAGGDEEARPVYPAASARSG